MRYYILPASVLFCVAVRAQTVTPAVVSSSGTHTQNSSAQLDYTIGEPVTTTLTATGNILTQGFHQPKVSTVGTDEWTTAGVSLFPNPASNSVTIDVPGFSFSSYCIYDASGKLVATDNIVAEKFNIDLNNWETGIYSLLLKGRSEAVLTFIKH